MALINCPECGRQVSDQAASCPQCGHPLTSNAVTSDQPRLVPPVVQQKGHGCLWWGAMIVGGLIVLSVLAKIGSSSSSTTSNATTSGSPTTLVAAQSQSKPAAATATPRPPTPVPPTATPLPGVGDRADTSGWGIKLDKIETAKEIGNQFSKKQAQGIYVLVTFTASNKQQRTSPLNAWDLKMRTASGQSFDASSDGTYIFDDPKPVILTDNVQPGLSKQFRNVFDVNPEIKDYTLEIAGTKFAVTLP